MSKLIEHAAYLEQDPLDIDSVYVVLKVGLSKAAVESGAIEIASKAEGWNETGSPCEHLRQWLVGRAVGNVVKQVQLSYVAPKIEEGHAMAKMALQALLPEAVFNAIYPPPPPEPEPE